MSMARKTVIFLSLVLASTLALIGCAKQEASPPPPELSPQEILAKAVLANAAINSCKYELDMTIGIEVTGGKEPGKATIVADSSGALDNAKKDMLLVMDMTMTIPDQTTQKVNMEMYLTGGWLYLKTSVPPAGVQWYKMKPPAQIWETESMVAQQLEFLKSATQATLLGSESVDGTACYVLRLEPDMTALFKWLAQQQIPGMKSLETEGLNLEKLIKSMAVKEWVAKDTFLLKKMELDMQMEMLPGDVGASTDDFDKMSMNMNMRMEFTEYNQPVSIVVPPEGLNAPEIPYQQ